MLKITVLLFLFTLRSYGISSSIPATDALSNSNVRIHVVAMENGELLPGTCNGVIISEQLVLTAAHCLAASVGIESQTIVEIGRLSELVPGKTVGQLAYRDLKKIKAAKFFFLDSINSKVASGFYKKENTIRVEDDLALIQLADSIDLREYNIPKIQFLNLEQYADVMRDAASFQFKAISTNSWEYQNMDFKREAHFEKIIFNNILEIEHGHLINTFDLTKYLQGTDSGCPLFVKYNNQWNLIGIGKGFEEKFPYHSAFAPVTLQIQNLLQQVK